MIRPGKTVLALTFVVTLFSIGCAKESPQSTSVTETPAAKTEPIVLTGFATPESVIYDAEQDVYFVSNINGSPVEADGNGSISRVTADDQMVEAKWIDGESEDIALDAPKGLAIVGDELWVADITRVRKFDRVSGEPKGEVEIEGAGFLNALAVAPDGSVVVSDSGLTVGESGIEPSGTDAVYRIATDGSVEKLAEGDDLTRPNGVVVVEGGVLVVTFGGNEIYRIVDGAKTDVTTVPGGSLDGLIALDGGDILVSSWETSTVYRGHATGPFTPIVTDVDAPADIGFDSKRNLILVPHFNENTVSLHRLSE